MYRPRFLLHSLLSRRTKYTFTSCITRFVSQAPHRNRLLNHSFRKYVPTLGSTLLVKRSIEMEKRSIEMEYSSYKYDIPATIRMQSRERNACTGYLFPVPSTNSPSYDRPATARMYTATQRRNQLCLLLNPLPSERGKAQIRSEGPVRRQSAMWSNGRQDELTTCGQTWSAMLP